MKTTNNAQKTENKKIENPVSKTFAVVLSLVLISFTVSANGFWKHLLVNNTYGKMATLMVDQQKGHEKLLAYAAPITVARSAEISSTANLFMLETAKEQSLEIESWMADETYFVSNVVTNPVEPEESLTVEAWMTDSSLFNNPANDTESEPAMETEAWMLDKNIWTN